MDGRIVLFAVLFLAACPSDEPGGVGQGTGTTASATDPSTSGSTGSTSASAETTSGTTTGPSPDEVNYIFVTSTVHRANFGGVEAGDQICNERADAAGLPGQFIAWLSTSQVSAVDRVAGARGWYRPDGLPFADTPAELLIGNWYPPVLDEYGDVVPDVTRTFTGTRIDGSWDENTGSCADWTDDSTAASTRVGMPSGGNAEWVTFGTYLCDADDMRLTCMGISHDAPIDLEPARGRRGFVALPASVGGGVGAMDALCQSQADANGHPGSYLALIATSTVTASSRFDLTGPTWVRADGAKIWADAADMPSGRMLAPMIFDAAGNLATHLAWNGAPTPVDMGALDTTCDDWTSTTGMTLSGRTTHTGEYAFGRVDRDCGDAGAVYCLEE